MVVSDLHLGRGFDPATKRYRRLEAFFYDEDFRSFCRWACRDAGERGVPLALVLNGDVFDLLRIEPEPVPNGTPFQRRFGPLPTPAVAGRMVADILVGHPAFVEALADVLATGDEVVWVCGNHDLELQWSAPQDAVRAAVSAALAARGAPASALERLRFEAWFLLEPGRIWIEHGCQYDPESAFRFPLRARLADSPVAADVAERDMPLGNFFQRYLYNAFGQLTFIVPSSRANYRYFRFLLANQPRLLLRVARSQGLFLLQLMRRMARPPDPDWLRAAERGHAAQLAELAESSGLGERLLAVDGLKNVGAEAPRAIIGIFRQGARAVLKAIAVAVFALALLTGVSHAIDELTVGFGWKALLSLLLYLTFAALGASALVAAVVRLPPDEPPRRLREAAARIAQLVGVRMVAFGHTHEEVVNPIPCPSGQGWYFNTGTWLAVFTHDVLLPRERVQYTFLHVRGDEAELLQWSPGRGRPIPVVLLEEERPPSPDVAPLAPEEERPHPAEPKRHRSA